MNIHIHELSKIILTTLLNFHRQGDKKDIILLSSPRSGSTWLMNIIYTQPRMKIIDEPLDKNILDYHKLLPVRTRWNYINLTEREEKVFEDYLGNYCSTNLFGPYNPFDKNYKFFTNRRIIKVIRANGLIRWFSDNLDFHIIYLIRHPIAQSQSCIRKGHHCEIKEYLMNDSYIGTYFDYTLKKYIEDIFRSEDDLAKFVAEWCLDNIIPLTEIKSNRSNNYLVITYEELILKPKKITELLFKNLNLEDKESMFNEINRPSKVTDDSDRKTIKSIKEGNSDYLIKKWKRNISDRRENELFEIISTLGTDAYKPGEFFAEDWLLHFRD